MDVFIFFDMLVDGLLYLRPMPPYSTKITVEVDSDTFKEINNQLLDIYKVPPHLIAEGDMVYRHFRICIVNNNQ